MVLALQGHGRNFGTLPQGREDMAMALGACCPLGATALMCNSDSGTAFAM